MSGAAYYDEVAAYYDIEADEFEARVCDNHVRQHMLDAFRNVTMAYDPKHVLEVGYGPGVDMVWFAEQPEVEVVTAWTSRPPSIGWCSEKGRNHG